MKEKPEKRLLSKLLLIIGAVLIVAAVGIEASRYPWETLFGVTADAASMSDPAPIVLTGEDAGSTLVESDAAPSESPEALPEGILPGSESADAPASVYVRLGIIKIPKLNVSQHVLEGTQRQMRYGIGHVTGTDAIGAVGNCALAGHRTTAFRYLDMLSAGDTVTFEVGENTYTYTVYDSFDVLPDETWVLSDIQNEDYALTLITCTPYLVSSHRLIVRARLTDINGISPGEFYQNSAQEQANVPIS